MKQFSVLSAVVLFGSMAFAQQSKIGCYKASTGMVFNSVSDFNSVGYCGVQTCKNSAAFAMQGSRCYCADKIPPDSDLVDDSKCSFACPVWPQDNCGGEKLNSFYMVYDQGTAGDIPKAKDEASSTPSASTPPPAKSSYSTTTSAVQQTSKASSSSTPTPSQSSSSSKPSTAGIAAGVVVGVVVIAAIAGGLFLVLRNRKRKAIEEEHRRNAAVKPPNTAGSNTSWTDNRLDPVMAQRRMSDGSIADNQDYSRRILKVTNA